MIYKNKSKKGAFTLIEVIVSVTIISVLMLSVLLIYTNIVKTDKKLELQRVLQDNTKNIMEGLAGEIRNSGVDYSYYVPTTELIDYDGDGNKILAIKGSGQYCMMRNNNYCDPTCYTTPKGCTLGKLNTDIRLSDDMATISNLRFFISGKPGESITNLDKEGKVTIVLDIALATGKGIDPDVIEATKMHLETTVSEMFYKK